MLSLGRYGTLRNRFKTRIDEFFAQRPTAAGGDLPSGGAPKIDLVLTISTYSRLSWGNHLSRSYQHAVLGSQNLGDLYEALPCLSNEIPSEKSPDGSNHGYSEDEVPPHKGGVFCIEGVAYGDGQSEEDYSESAPLFTVFPRTSSYNLRLSKLIEHFSETPSNKKPEIRKGPNMHLQRFSDLSLRINEPYWLLHQGSCEHFIVIDQIRSVSKSPVRHTHILICVFLVMVFPS